MLPHADTVCAMSTYLRVYSLAYKDAWLRTCSVAGA